MITTRVHGILDYIIGIALIAAPWVFGFANSGPETWVPVILGAGSILYSLITNYELGLAGVLAMRTHLRLDIVVGILLAASPWIFGFAHVVWAPHLIVGLLILGLSMASHAVPSKSAAESGDTTHHHPTYGRR
jgi:hypothetical protein